MNYTYENYTATHAIATWKRRLMMARGGTPERKEIYQELHIGHFRFRSRFGRIALIHIILLFRIILHLK